MPNPLTKEAGGQPVWAWGAEAVGAFLVYRWWINRQAANAANAALGTTSGLPAVGTGVSGTGSTAAAPPSSWTDWLNSFISSATTANYGGGQALSDATAWINGGCVTAAGYTALSNALVTLGIPPGFGTGIPALSVCPSAPAPPKPPAPGTLVGTGQRGVPAGHPVDYAYLVGLGLIKKVGNGYVTTGRDGYPAGHPVDYAYLVGSGAIKPYGG